MRKEIIARQRRIMADNGLDPIVMDSSLGRAGAAYNASLVGTSLESVALWATHFVVPDLRPRVVLLGLSPVELNPNVPNEQRSIKAFRDAPAARRSLGRETLLAKADRLLGDVSSLFRYRTVLRTVTSWTAGRSNGAKGAAMVNDPALTPQGMSLTGRDTPYGTFLGRRVSAQTRAGQYQGDLFHQFTVGADKTAALRQIVADLRTEGARVVIVELPLTNDAVAYLPHGQGDLTATGEALRLVAGQTGADYLATGVWPTSLFADPGHLNGRGFSLLTAGLLTRRTARAPLRRPYLDWTRSALDRTRIRPTAESGGALSAHRRPGVACLPGRRNGRRACA